ncbi:MAG: toll/interleukin-1 receptor domain-containing protein [Thiolinea sp.]
MSKVFISYSHDSEAHRERVLALSNRLRGDGIDCWIDQYEPAPPEGWPRKMDKGIRDADFVLMVCTAIYLRRLQLEEEEGKGLGVAWEGSLIYNTLYRDRTLNFRFIPILFNPDDKQHIPTILFGNSHYDLSLPLGYEHLYRHLRGELGTKMPELGRPRFVRTIHSDDLPTVEGELFGRREELELLDRAFAGEPETPSPQPLSLTGRGAKRDKPNIVQFIASGGTGKTKLIRHWLDENHDKIEALIAWSFYSQGSSEDKQISATPFFMQALKSLGSDKTVSDFNTEEEKGEYVADLLRERRCLLVLDGLEPLQQVGRGMRGELKDRAIRKMLRCLVGDHSSLCIITTRLEVHELKGRKQVVSYPLDNLQPEDGVALLRSFGVSGREADMLAAVEEYGRHALALHLLGNALATYLDGDVRKRDTLTELIGDYDDVERHAFKVMQAYQHWLTDENGEPSTELRLLYLLGLFDHPVEQEVLEVLWEAEIPGLTEGVPKKAWLVARRDLLGKFRMMSEHEGREDLFDCHPLIQEYFGRQLKENEGEVWRQAHTVLYEYYKGLPKKYQPDTLEEMQPLFRAVAHGCKSGSYTESWELFVYRLQRENVNYLLRKLVGANEDLSCIGYFFQEGWGKLPKQLDKSLQAMLYSRASIDLRIIGRLDEARIPLEKSLHLFEQSLNPIDLSANLNNFSELNLALGNIEYAGHLQQKGIEVAQDAIEALIQSNDKKLLIKAKEQFWIGISNYADICFQYGFSEIEGYFKQAEGVVADLNDEIPFLHGFAGVKYCEYLLHMGRSEEALNRAMAIIEVGRNDYEPPETLYAMTLASKIYLLKGDLVKAKICIDVTGKTVLSYAPREVIPVYLLIKSRWYAESREYQNSVNIIIETYEIAESSGMRLHLTDYHLEMARLILAIEADPTQYPEATPDREQRTLPPELADPDEPGILTLKGHILEAERLINETGYHRRDAELAELKQQAGMSC